MNTELFHRVLKTKNLFAKSVSFFFKKNIYFKTNAEKFENKGKLWERKLNLRKSKSIKALEMFQAVKYIKKSQKQRPCIVFLVFIPRCLSPKRRHFEPLGR